MVTTHIFTYVVFLVILTGLVDCALTNLPVNVVGNISQPFAQIICATNLDLPVKWTHTPPGQTAPRNVYWGSGTILPNYRPRFSVTRTQNGFMNLKIVNVTWSDAGLYTCIDRAGAGIDSGHYGSADLIVIGTFLRCSHNMSEDGVVSDDVTCSPPGPDIIDFTCSIHYSGNISPKLHWTIGDGVSNDVAIHDFINVTTESTVSSSVIVNVTKSMNGSVFTCSSDMSAAMSAGGSDSITVPSLNWTSNPLNLLYLATSDTLVQQPITRRCTVKSCPIVTNIKTCATTTFNVSNNETWSVPGSDGGGFHLIHLTECRTSNNRTCWLSVTIPVTGLEHNESTKRNSAWVTFLVLAVIFLVIVIIIYRRFTRQSVNSLAQKCPCFQTKANAAEMVPLEANHTTNNVLADPDNIRSTQEDELQKAVVKSEITTLMQTTSPVSGLATLKNKIYIALRKCRDLYVFEADKPFKNLKSISVSNLIDPTDLGACSVKLCLYIVDNYTGKVYRINCEENNRDQCQLTLTIDAPHTISVANNGDLLQVRYFKNPEKSYKVGDLELIPEICVIKESRTNPSQVIRTKIILDAPDQPHSVDSPLPTPFRHAIQIGERHFVIASGDDSTLLQKVTRLGMKVTKADFLGRPAHMTPEGSDGYFYLVTSEDVLLLNSDLAVVYRLDSDNDRLRNATRLCCLNDKQLLIGTDREVLICNLNRTSAYLANDCNSGDIATYLEVT